MEKWQFKKAYYLHTWLLAIAVFIDLNYLGSHYINHNITSNAIFGCLLMLPVFFVLSLLPLFKKHYVAPFILIPLTIFFGFFYLLIFGLGMRFSAYDSFDAYGYQTPIQIRENEMPLPPTQFFHEPNFPDFQLFTQKQGVYHYQVFLETPLAGSLYLKPFTTPLIDSLPDNDITSATSLTITNLSQTVTINNQSIFTAQSQPFVLYQQKRWADYDVCLYLMFIPDDKSLPEKNLREKCFNVQGVE